MSNQLTKDPFNQIKFQPIATITPSITPVNISPSSKEDNYIVDKFKTIYTISQQLQEGKDLNWNVIGSKVNKNSKAVKEIAQPYLDLTTQQSSWSENEHEQLLLGYWLCCNNKETKLFEPYIWENVRFFLPNRTGRECRQEFYRILKYANINEKPHAFDVDWVPEISKLRQQSVDAIDLLRRKGDKRAENVAEAVNVAEEQAKKKQKIEKRKPVNVSASSSAVNLKTATRIARGLRGSFFGKSCVVSLPIPPGVTIPIRATFDVVLPSEEYQQQSRNTHNSNKGSSAANSVNISGNTEDSSELSDVSSTAVTNDNNQPQLAARKHRCNRCGKGFNSEVALKAHMTHFKGCNGTAVVANSGDGSQSGSTVSQSGSKVE